MRVEKYSDLIARLHARPRRRLTLLVGVDGDTGPGGSSFTRTLVDHDPELELVALEAFQLPISLRPSRSPDSRPRPVLDHLDWRRLRSQVLLPLGRDQPARYQVYDARADALAGEREVSVGGIVLVEGLYSCIPQLAPFYDFRVWIDFDGGRSARADEAAYPPEDSANLRVTGSARVPHDPRLEYVRLDR